MWPAPPRKPLPAVKLPGELDKLLREKELQGKKQSVQAVKDLYTEDLMVLDPGRNYWHRLNNGYDVALVERGMQR